MATCDAIAAAHARYGYDPVALPRVPVGERAAFVLEALR